MKNSKPRVFVSYSRADAEYRQELLVHLRPIESLFELWHDQQIQAGTDWKQAIDEALAAADIVILLISPDFLASDFCVSTELFRAFERWLRKQVRIIPILVRDCSWTETPIAKLQVLCAEKPIASYERRAQRDAEWRALVQHLQTLMMPTARMQAGGSVPYDAGARAITVPPIDTSPKSTLSNGIIGEFRLLRRSTQVLAACVLALAAVGVSAIATLLLGQMTIQSANSAPATIESASPPAAVSPYQTVEYTIGGLIADATDILTICRSAAPMRDDCVTQTRQWLRRVEPAVRTWQQLGLADEHDFNVRVKLRTIDGFEDPDSDAQAIRVLQRGAEYIQRIASTLETRDRILRAQKGG